ncbi:MAG: hypothetical protein AAGA97_05315 [Pseudomonadota bacterium]
MRFAVFVTLSAILCWSLLSVTGRVVLVRLQIDPWLFGFLQLCAGGLALLIVSGPGVGNLQSFKRASTWIISGLRVLSATIYTVVVALISVLEAGTIASVNIPVLALVLWLMFSKRPGALEWAGHFIIAAAVILMTLQLEQDLQIWAIGLMLLNAACLAAMHLLAEKHPENTSDNFRDRFRFTGAVLLITALLFAISRLGQSGSFEGITDRNLLIASALVGVFLRAPAMVLAFWAIRLVGTQKYTAAIALLPIGGMAFEQSAVWLGLLDFSRFQVTHLGLSLVVIMGTFMTLAAKSAAK